MIFQPEKCDGCGRAFGPGDQTIGRDMWRVHWWTCGHHRTSYCPACHRCAAVMKADRCPECGRQDEYT